MHEIYNVFIMAAAEVLNTEAAVELTRGKLELRRDAYVTDDITVLISLVGDISGAAILSMSLDTAKAIIARILDQEILEFDELAQSGIGELGNVITGQASTRMAELGLDTDISVPTLILGKGSSISTLDINRLIVPLKTELGTVKVNLALRKVAKGSTSKQAKSGLQMAIV